MIIEANHFLVASPVVSSIFAVRQVLALRFKDTQCGLKPLTSEAADQVFQLLSLDGWGYDPEMIHVATALNCVFRK